MHNFAVDAAKARPDYHGGFNDFSASEMQAVPNWITNISLASAVLTLAALGTYNPDWAVTGGSNGAPMVHLVSESKSDFTALRDNEYAKVRCGEAHFKAIGVEYVKAVNAEDILERLVDEG